MGYLILYKAVFNIYINHNETQCIITMSNMVGPSESMVWNSRSMVGTPLRAWRMVGSSESMAGPS